MFQRAIEVCCIAVLITGCLIGGSNEPGRLLPSIPQLLSLPLLTLALMFGTRRGLPDRASVWFVVTILLLPLLQLIPLPPTIWTSLPGRGPVAQAYSAADIALPWLPISLTPSATVQVWLGLLPAVALFLAVPNLAVDAQRRLLHVAIAFGVLDAALGFGQLVGGQNSPLRMYATASRMDAVGFFANRNHQATFLSMLVVLAGSLAVGRSTSVPERIWLAFAGTLMLLGIAASGSRAGLALGVGAFVATAWILIASRLGDRKTRSMLFWGVLSGLLLLIVVGILVIGSHVDSLAGDLRWEIARTTWHAILLVFPVGAGFGSFERFYAHVEPPDDLIAAIINNAHNDWLELTLEGGLPVLLLLVLGLAYLVRETLVDRRWSGQTAFQRATLSVTLAAMWFCALHSTVDYPLRTMAVNIILALACGLRVAALGEASGAGSTSRSRARSKTTGSPSKLSRHRSSDDGRIEGFVTLRRVSPHDVAPGA